MVMLVDLVSKLSLSFVFMPFISSPVLYISLLLELELESHHKYLSVAFNLKSITFISMMKGEEQDFKEMIESEYRIRFQLMVEEEMKSQSLQGCVFNLNVREDGLNQLMEFGTELKEKSQETLQVRCGKLRAHSVWKMRAEHYANSKMGHPVTTTHVLKECVYSPSSSISDHLSYKYTYMPTKR